MEQVETLSGSMTPEQLEAMSDTDVAELAVQLTTLQNIINMPLTAKPSIQTKILTDHL